MNAQQRHRIANRTRYRVHLDAEERTISLIEQYFMPKDEYKKLDKLDRAVIAKIAHWFGVYVTKLNSLPKDFESIKVQYSLTASLTGVEASIGMPKNRSGGRILNFYQANLTQTQQNELSKKFQFYKIKSETPEARNLGLEQVIKQLLQRRHGLLHRAELINLSPDKNTVVGSRGHVTRGKGAGKIQHYLAVRLTPEEFSEYTILALKNYFNIHWTKRIPKQDFVFS